MTQSEMKTKPDFKPSVVPSTQKPETELEITKKIFEWLDIQKYQTEYDDTGEYKMYFGLDIPKIIMDWNTYVSPPLLEEGKEKKKTSLPESPSTVKEETQEELWKPEWTLERELKLFAEDVILWHKGEIDAERFHPSNYIPMVADRIRIGLSITRKS